MGGKEVDKSSALPQWILDYQLVEWGQQGLFYEYLEMGKFSFAHYESIHLNSYQFSNFQNLENRFFNFSKFSKISLPILFEEPCFDYFSV